MQTHTSTSPFGRRPLSLAMVASQAHANDCPQDAAVHKWEVFRAVCEGRRAIGASERALAVLNALLTFHPETVLTAGGDQVVYPSNLQLALRAHGMAAATLRRHLASLVDVGLIIRRDSPNGKRYVRRGSDGEASQAFGFDLTPLVARAAEFEGYAREVRSERKEAARQRERITIFRRDAAKMIATGQEEGVEGDWPAIRTIYRNIVDRLPRIAGSAALHPIADELAMLVVEIRMLLEDHIKSLNSDASESHNEQHIQNSKTDISIDSEPDFQGRGAGEVEPISQPSKSRVRTFPLPVILDACPDIIDYVKGGVSDWRSLSAAAELVRSILGISPSAWDDAQGAIGAEDAAVVIAAILQRGPAINSPGGYLRGLTEKAKRGKFSIGPMVMALLRARNTEKMRA